MVGGDLSLEVVWHWGSERRATDFVHEAAGTGCTLQARSVVEFTENDFSGRQMMMRLVRLRLATKNRRDRQDLLSVRGTGISLAIDFVASGAGILAEFGPEASLACSSRSSRTIATTLLVRAGEPAAVLGAEGDMMVVRTVAIAMPLASRIRRRSSQLGSLPLSMTVDSGNFTGAGVSLAFDSPMSSASTRR